MPVAGGTSAHGSHRRCEDGGAARSTSRDSDARASLSGSVKRRFPIPAPFLSALDVH